MDDRERIEELLDRYEDGLEAGLPPRVEDLCRDCPHLIEEVGKKINLLARVDELVAIDHAEHAAEIPAETVAGRYRATAHLGQGGLGQVFVAVDEELEREVALKRILPGRAAGEDNRARFRREARITGRLEHPGVVPVYGLGSDSKGRPYYAMRRVGGDTLDEAIERHHRSELGLPVLLRNYLAVCQTVAYAHSKGIIHRDLKPQNVLVGEFGETLVIDWGLAKPLAEVETDAAAENAAAPAEGVTPTMHGSRKGSPAYMSPEQAEGLPASEASDVYALGATLYKVLSGRAPFGDTPDIWNRIRTGDCPSPRSVQREVPAALDAVCRKAMAVRAADRYATALDLAADIEHWLADEPVSAARDPFAVRCRRWARRHRSLVLSAASMLAVGIAGLIVLFVREDRANRALAKSNDELTQANGRVEKALAETARERDRAQMNLAAIYLAENKFVRAADLLRRSSPRPGDANDFRSFEWYYLSKQFTADRIEVQGPPAPIAVAITGDRRWIASSTGWQVSLFNAATGKLALSLPVAPRSPLVTFSTDGSLLAVPGDKRVVLWRLSGDRWERGPDIEKFEHECDGFALAPRGDLLAASGDGGRLRLFDPRTGMALADSRVLQGTNPAKDPIFEQLVFSADGTRLAGVHLVAPIVFEIGLRKDAGLLKLAYRGGNELKAVSTWFEGKKNDLAIKELAGDIRVFDGYRMEQRRVRLPAGSTCVAALPSEDRPSYLALSTSGAWLLRTSVAIAIPFDQPVTAFSVAAEGKTAAFGLADGRIVADPHVSEPVLVFRHPDSAMVSEVHTSRDGRQLLSADSQRTVLYGPFHGETTFRLAEKIAPGIFSKHAPVRVAMAADDKEFAIADGAGIAIVDAGTAKTVKAIPIDLEAGLLRLAVPVAFDRDGRQLAWASPQPDGATLKFTTAIHVWDRVEDREVHRFEVDGKASSLAYSLDGKLLAVSNGDAILLRNADGSGVTRRLPGQGPFVALCFAPDSSRVAAGTATGAVQIWSSAGTPEGPPELLHGAAVTGLAFFPGGRLLAASAEGSIKLFDTADRTERASFACGMPVRSLAVAADGNTIVAGSDRGVCLVFRPTDDASIVRMLQACLARMPGNAAVRRDLAIAAWGWHLERLRANDGEASRKALQIGLGVCETLEKTPETENWKQAFQTALENFAK